VARHHTQRRRSAREVAASRPRVEKLRGQGSTSAGVDPCYSAAPWGREAAIRERGGVLWVWVAGQRRAPFGEAGGFAFPGSRTQGEASRGRPRGKLQHEPLWRLREPMRYPLARRR